MLSISYYDGVKYHSSEFMNRDKDFFGNGVVQATHFPYTLPSPNNMTLSIGAGTAWVDGYRIANDANSMALTIPAADSTNPRIDIVQIGHDDINSQAVLTIKKGVAAASPTEPSADPNYVKLYAINVPANATSITASNITDRRTLVPLNVSGTQINLGGSAGTGQPNTFSQTQTFSDAPAPINITSLTQLPAVAAKDTMVVVNNMWYRSDGTQWNPMASPAPANASTSTVGIVELNSATNSTDETTAATPKAIKTVNDALGTHEADTTNPHKVTASQVGLGNVTNDAQIPKSLLTTAGDTLYASAANTPARLAKGTAYQTLGMNSGATAPQWQPSPQSLMTATGDLLYASGANTPARLGVGTSGQVLTVNNGVPTWQTLPNSGSWTTISTVTLATDTTQVDFTSIPQTYKNLKVIVSGMSNDNTTYNTSVLLRVNDITSSIYFADIVDGSGSTGNTGQNALAQQAWFYAFQHFPTMYQLGAATPTIGTIEIDIPLYTNTSFNRVFKAVSSSIVFVGGSNANAYGTTGLTGGGITSNVAVTKVSLLLGNGAYKTGTQFILMGCN